MKKKLALLLATLMCISLCACGGSETGNKDVNIEEWENGPIVYISRKQLSERLKKVTITKENWQEYFADYDYTEHIVKKNDFGDIESEYDVRHCGFGIKRDICAIYEKVSFKFDGVTNMSYKGATSVYEAGNNKVKHYDENGVLVREDDCESKEYYLVELYSRDGVEYTFYGEHECIDVIGEIIIVDLPFEEPYYGQINFDFTDGGWAISNMWNYNFWSDYLEE